MTGDGGAERVWHEISTVSSSIIRYGGNEDTYDVQHY